jgi:fluoroquinolone transport system permease protein
VRFLAALKNDVRHQLRYGFYFLYMFVSVIYAIILAVCPSEYKQAAASVIVLTDPATLGMFFVGGVWLLEKGEGLHEFWRVSPLRPIEYILSKTVSLAVISAFSANMIVLSGHQGAADYLRLTIGVFAGSMVFTAVGLIVASYARSVNHYMLIATPPAVLLTIPPILAVFGITHPVLELLPGTALWRVIGHSIGYIAGGGVSWIILLGWLAIAIFAAKLRIPAAMRGEKAWRTH